MSFQDPDGSMHPMRQITIISPILKIRKLRHEKVKNLLNHS